ncbi:DNA cytosine methyltransferase [Candidatus Izemoplasma sp. B36]|uniref:DNA cytosine methyltransferase n=1 Tax=Candidatus Izemoplasma sp. B36 TaxID=3242468 RepID=UPI003555BE44
MIRLGSVFSGIGAIEFALRRLNWDHEIVFACDNGNVNLDINYKSHMSNIRRLKSIDDKKLYVDELYKSKTKRTNFVKISYLSNYKLSEKRFFNDIKLFDGRDFNGAIDLLVGGSPCQSFSAIGRKSGLEDTRGTLFYDFARIVKETRPRVFIYENVYGLLKHDKGNTWKVIMEVFESLGYGFKFSVLDSRDFGIPQGRRRVFVVGFKNKSDLSKFNFPKPLKLTYSLQDFLLNNCALGKFTSCNSNICIKRSNGVVSEKLYLSEKLKKYVLSPGTKNFFHKDAKIDLDIARAILSTQGNSHRASVNNYVTTNGKIRALDPRESLRLMGFTDDFIINVSKSQAYKQSGNSIVVDVLIHLLKAIYNGGSNEENH